MLLLKHVSHMNLKSHHLTLDATKTEMYALKYTASTSCWTKS